MQFQFLFALAAAASFTAALPTAKTSNSLVQRGCYCPENTTPDASGKCAGAKGTATAEMICPSTRDTTSGKKCKCPFDTMPDYVYGQCIEVQTDKVVEKVCE